MDALHKFIRFTKVDSTTREVSGIVTAEAPDKDREVCDYEKSKPYYKDWSAEFAKSTDGKSVGNLREMHQLSAVGVGKSIEFNDAEKEIVMTFKVVDDDAWRKCEERVYTGFSQGGRKVGDQTPDPVYKGCMRYVAKPSEISLVDNPCLPDAHFLYVKADGTQELRKFLKTEVPATETERIATLEEQVKVLTKAAQPAAQPAAVIPITTSGTITKRVAGSDLPASSFAYVGDANKPETWELPLHTAPYVRKAIACFSEAKGIPSTEKAKVRSKIIAAAKTVKVDVATEEDKLAAIRAAVRKAARIYVNKNASKIKNQHVLSIDSDLGKLTKGMWEVSRLACALEMMSEMVFAVCAEQEWENDEDSKLPEMLADNVKSLTETFLEMVEEETRELQHHVEARVA